MQDLTTVSKDAIVTDPKQFNIIDLFAMLTIAALLLAVAAPYLRELSTEGLLQLSLTTLVQSVIAIGAIVLLSAQRRSLLAGSGRRLGMAYCGEGKWRHWPAIYSVLVMLLVAGAQLALSIGLTTLKHDHHGMRIHYLSQIQLAITCGYVMSRFMWRLYPNTIEFFENGVSFNGLSLKPWNAIELRPSELYSDRVVVVLRPPGKAFAVVRKMARVNDALRSVLIDKAMGHVPL